MPIRELFQGTKCNNPDVVVFYGVLAMDGDSTAPTVSAGRGITAAVAATGVLTITLPIGFQKFVGWGWNQGQGTVAKSYQKMTAYSVTNRTFTISNFTQDTTTALAWQAAATYNEIAFWIAVQTSSTPAT